MNWIEIPSVLTIDIKPFSRIIGRIGTNEFDITLLNVLNELSPVPVVECRGYIYPINAAPIVVGYCGVRADTPYRVEKYTQYYSKDPLLQDFPSNTISKFGFVKAFYPKDISNADYRKVFFEQPKFGAEINIAFHDEKGWNVMKFYVEAATVTSKKILYIGKIAALLYPIARRHALTNENEVSLESRPKTVERLLLRLQNRFPQLTQRECQVCALTILGNSAQKIAEIIDVSPNTVITYRQRAYSKLGVSNANSLVRELI